jgi:hypothetical protein
MSALGQKQTFAPQKVMSALSLKADIRRNETSVESRRHLAGGSTYRL